MYYCPECDTFFDELAAGEERVGSYGDRPYYVPYTECPNCRSDYYEDAEYCEYCEDYFPSCVTMTFLSKGKRMFHVCPECREELMQDGWEE